MRDSDNLNCTNLFWECSFTAPLLQPELYKFILRVFLHCILISITCITGHFNGSGMLSPWGHIKRLTFSQYAHYNLLSSKTHQNFPSYLYSTQYLMIFSEFCCFIAIPVIALPPPFLLIRKLVSTGSHDREVLHYTECAWRHWLESDLKWTNDGWQCHDKTC
jgi:hypothetical protein